MLVGACFCCRSPLSGFSLASRSFGLRALRSAKTPASVFYLGAGLGLSCVVCQWSQGAASLGLDCSYRAIVWDPFCHFCDWNLCGSLLVVVPLEGGSVRCHVPDLVLAVHAVLTPLEPVCAPLLPAPIYDYFLVWAPLD